MKSPWFLSPLFAVVLFTQCEKTDGPGDVSFAKDTFESLARGDSATVDEIDWMTLQSLGQNVGAAYAQLPTEAEKNDFEASFVTQFAASFRDAGGRIESFENWRVVHDDELRTEVAATSPGGTLTITVNDRDGKERISALNFVP